MGTEAGVMLGINRVGAGPRCPPSRSTDWRRGAGRIPLSLSPPRLCRRGLATDARHFARCSAAPRDDFGVASADLCMAGEGIC